MVKRLVSLLLIGAFAVDAQAEKLGNWQHDVQISALDDTRTDAFSVESTNEIPDRIGIPRRGALFLICNGSAVAVGLDMQNYMGIDLVPVRYRFDKGPVQSGTASVMSGGRYIGWLNGSGRSIVGHMRDAKRFVLAAAPSGQGETEAVFDLDGIKQVMEVLSSRCPQ